MIAAADCRSCGFSSTTSRFTGQPAVRSSAYGAAWFNVRVAIDAIILTVPGERRFLGVVNLVLGGLGSRLDLPYAQVDDLQLAVDSVLAQGDAAVAGTLTVEIEVGEGRLTVRMGPLVAGRASDAGLRRVLAPLVASAAPLDRDGREWVELEIERHTADVESG